MSKVTRNDDTPNRAHNAEVSGGAWRKVDREFVPHDVMWEIRNTPKAKALKNIALAKVCRRQ
jgi:hypothetical protein